MEWCTFIINVLNEVYEPGLMYYAHNVHSLAIVPSKAV